MNASLLLMGLDDDAILLLTPFLLDDLGVEVVVPSLAALLPDPARKVLRYKTPIFRTKLFH